MFLFYFFEQTDQQEPSLGLLVTVVEGTDKKLSFRSADVITKATMMVGDKVQFNISTNSVTEEESAVNLMILPESFHTESEEQRKIVSVFMVGVYFCGGFWPIHAGCFWRPLQYKNIFKVPVTISRSTHLRVVALWGLGNGVKTPVVN